MNSKTKQQENARKTASAWFVRLSSGTATAQDYQEWKAWREADAEHESAWEKLEQLTQQFQQYSSEIAVTGALRRLYTAKKSKSKDAAQAEIPSSASPKAEREHRRRVLKQLGILLTAGTASYFGYTQQPWQRLTADYRTATGEHREIALDDGTRLHMNTNSAINVLFDSKARTITLLKGEVLISTGHEHGTAYRPFRVNTAHGEVAALGTHFSVMDQHSVSSVSVFDGAVQLRPQQLPQAAITLQAGTSARFSTSAITQTGSADIADASWAQGFIIADKMPLDSLIQSLARYRTGLLLCDPRIAQIKVSGAFPTDSDAALQILAQKFPIKIENRTRYWTKVLPA